MKRKSMVAILAAMMVMLTSCGERTNEAAIIVRENDTPIQCVAGCTCVGCICCGTDQLTNNSAVQTIAVALSNRFGDMDVPMNDYAPCDEDAATENKDQEGEEQP